MLVVKLRFGNLGFVFQKWKIPLAVFILSSAIAATIFYHSGIDELLRICVMQPRARELFSTAAWSIILTTVTILPFAVGGDRFEGVFCPKDLPWTIVITFISTMCFLLPYFIFFPLSDLYRGFFAGAGMRTGMFLGLYFASLSSLKLKRKV